MNRYFVESGRMKATMFADNPAAAAMDSFTWWGESDDEITVYERGFRQGEMYRFDRQQLENGASGRFVSVAAQV